MFVRKKYTKIFFLGLYCNKNDECYSQIKEYIEHLGVSIVDKDLEELLKSMIEEKLIIINESWSNEKNEFPYSLTEKGKEIWNNIKE